MTTATQTVRVQVSMLESCHLDYVTRADYDAACRRCYASGEPETNAKYYAWEAMRRRAHAALAHVATRIGDTEHPAIYVGPEAAIRRVCEAQAGVDCYVVEG